MPTGPHETFRVAKAFGLIDHGLTMRLLDQLKTMIRSQGGGRKVILGADRYNEIMAQLTNNDIFDVSLGGRGIQSLSAIYGVPVEIDHRDRQRVEIIQ